MARRSTLFNLEDPNDEDFVRDLIFGDVSESGNILQDYFGEVNDTEDEDNISDWEDSETGKSGVDEEAEKEEEIQSETPTSQPQPQPDIQAQPQPQPDIQVQPQPQQTQALSDDNLLWIQ